MQAGLLVIEAGFLFAQSFFVLMLLFAIGELALFAGQAPCSECSATCAVGPPTLVNPSSTLRKIACADAASAGHAKARSLCLARTHAELPWHQRK